MQTSKVAIITAVVVVIAGVSWYILQSPTTPPVAVTPKAQEAAPTAPETAQQNSEPTKAATNDQIIDYVVDGITKTESADAKAAIDAQAPQTSVDAATSINTNF